MLKECVAGHLYSHIAKLLKRLNEDVKSQYRRNIYRERTEAEFTVERVCVVKINNTRYHEQYYETKDDES